jgi:ring-1,2-phenylacetyl-CoA epoxidase subunit PaaD
VTRSDLPRPGPAPAALARTGPAGPAGTGPAGPVRTGTDPADVAAAVPDPELGVVTVGDLGILRDVRTVDGRVTVTITPTYSGCPAMEVIRADIVRSLAAAGHPDAVVRTRLAPAWTTDWITDAGRAKLAAAGIAPPGPAGPVLLGLPAPAGPALPGPGRTTASAALPAGAVGVPVACPRCGAAETEELSRFGSTACKALRRCRGCGEPFEAVKPL